ncbi:hypothetical protein N7510_005095 [Penicillium lagena]|uniref:uncharacterized protein n=1 Tax=Penicillium lagena TaxID=94218 RepID=UPI00253FB299|nr:uncharacterized protein N7510_005095 [Penicillium lagena]KAJ5621111.1 hypothetical protein N7510_005095 [Penicillium lagena]
MNLHRAEVSSPHLVLAAGDENGDAIGRPGVRDEVRQSIRVCAVGKRADNEVMAEADGLVDPGHAVGMEVDLARAGIDGARDEGSCSR